MKTIALTLVFATKDEIICQDSYIIEVKVQNAPVIIADYLSGDRVAALARKIVFTVELGLAVEREKAYRR